MSISENLKFFKNELPEKVSLVAVSKTKPLENLQEAYTFGQRIFGENKIQEMTEKWQLLPKDIEWHMIGHVQTNKVKYMAPYVSLIHGVDRLKVWSEIHKQALKNDRIIPCLLQVYIADEETKFGFSECETLFFFRLYAVTATIMITSPINNQKKRFDSSVSASAVLFSEVSTARKSNTGNEIKRL